MADTVTYSGGGLFTLFVALLIVKITGLYSAIGLSTLSWWIVTLPLWISFAIAGVIILIAMMAVFIILIFYGIFSLIKYIFFRG